MDCPSPHRGPLLSVADCRLAITSRAGVAVERDPASRVAGPSLGVHRPTRGRGDSSRQLQRAVLGAFEGPADWAGMQRRPVGPEKACRLGTVVDRIAEDMHRPHWCPHVVLMQEPSSDELQDRSLAAERRLGFRRGGGVGASPRPVAWAAGRVTAVEGRPRRSEACAVGWYRPEWNDFL